MIKQLFQRWKLQPSAPDAEFADGRHAQASADLPSPPASPSSARPPLREAATSEAPASQAASAMGQLLKLSIQQLSDQRNQLDQQCQQTERQMEGLHIDRRGLATRYARARLEGKPMEMQAVERQLIRLKARGHMAQALHAYQLKQLDLLDRLQALREDADLRRQVMQGALQGHSLKDIADMVSLYQAAVDADDQATRDLTDGMDLHAEEEARKQDHAQAEARAELMGLTEGLVQQAAHAQLQPLEQAADELEARVKSRGRKTPPEAAN